MTKKAKAQQEFDFFKRFADEHKQKLDADDLKQIQRIKKWLATRKKAGRHIDPKTAEVTWDYAYMEDPYGVWQSIPLLTRELDCVGREYFARAPESRVWVHFADLPAKTRDALLKMHLHRLCSFVVHDGRGRWNI
jgi:hypothetical protein